MVNDVSIIGAGPAGLTAAIYLLRAGYNVTVYEKAAPGGKVNSTSHIENYPGFETISGPDLAFKMYEHAIKLGVKILSKNIISLEKQEDKFILKTNKEDIESGAVIIATGTHERKLEIENSSKFENHGISYCAVCDGNFYQNKKVAVIGGGESALKEALYLSRICAEVYLVHRRDEFRANDTLVNEIKNSNIELKLFNVPTKLIGENKLQGLEIQNINSKELETLDVEGVFPYLGALPNTDFININDLKTNNGYMIVDSKMKTNIDGLFAAGDVLDKELRQVVTATSDGAIAAMSAIEYLKKI